MNRSLANHTYYRECQGHWRCALTLKVTSVKALRASLGWMDLMSVMALAYWPRWLGRFFLETSVDYRGDVGEVTHTTCFRWLRLPLMQSTEVLHLEEGGENFTLVGKAKSLLAPWRRLPMEGSGRVLPSVMEAIYSVTWLGTMMYQRTVRDGDIVTLTQKTAGFEGVQRLERIKSPKGQ